MQPTELAEIAPTSAVQDYLPDLRAFSRTFYRNLTDADDLLQETLVKALVHIDQFKPGTRMKSWLFTIMRNTFYTAVRKASRETTGVADCVSNRQSVEAGQEWSITRREVGAALQRLPASQREVVVLVTILGNSYEEAAAICACTIGTIKSRLNRARNSLLDDLGEISSGSLMQSGSRISRHDLGEQRAL